MMSELAYNLTSFEQFYKHNLQGDVTREPKPIKDESVYLEPKRQ